MVVTETKPGVTQEDEEYGIIRVLSYLFAIAYRMLGSAMDAEDMAQKTYLRFVLL